MTRTSEAGGARYVLARMSENSKCRSLDCSWDVDLHHSPESRPLAGPVELKASPRGEPSGVYKPVAMSFQVADASRTTLQLDLRISCRSDMFFRNSNLLRRGFATAFPAPQHPLISHAIPARHPSRHLSEPQRKTGNLSDGSRRKSRGRRMDRSHVELECSSGGATGEVVRFPTVAREVDLRCSVE